MGKAKAHSLARQGCPLSDTLVGAEWANRVASSLMIDRPSAGHESSCWGTLQAFLAHRLDLC